MTEGSPRERSPMRADDSGWGARSPLKTHRPAPSDDHHQGGGMPRSPRDSRDTRETGMAMSAGDGWAPPPHSSYGRSTRRAPPSADEETVPSAVLGVFGLSVYTKEIDLEGIFSEFGTIEKCLIIMDSRTERSRGFGFITFSSVEEATKAKEALNGTELHDRKMRVDYSKTRAGHAATPGHYAGERRDSPYDRGDMRDGGHRDYRPPRDDYRRDAGHMGGRDMGPRGGDMRGYRGDGRMPPPQGRYGPSPIRMYEERRPIPGGYGRERGYDEYNERHRGGGGYEREREPPRGYEPRVRGPPAHEYERRDRY